MQLDQSRSTVTVKKVRMASDACGDSACVDELLSQISTDIRESVDTDTLKVEIIDWARERVPPVEML